MKQDYAAWVRRNDPAGHGWTGRLLPLAAAGTASALVGLSVVLLAGSGLPAGQQTVATGAPAAIQAAASGARHADPLPTVMVVGRRQPGDAAPSAVPVGTVHWPAGVASGAAATVGLAGSDNLRQ